MYVKYKSVKVYCWNDHNTDWHSDCSSDAPILSKYKTNKTDNRFFVVVLLIPCQQGEYRQTPM